MNKRLLVTVLMCIALVLTLVLANDATHPVLIDDTCGVTATGPSVAAYKTQYQLLYQNGSNPLHDVALDCKRLGKIWLNEPPPPGFPPAAGKQAHIKTKTYHYLPKQWRITLSPKVELNK
jgi:hypothetical protein